MQKHAPPIQGIAIPGKVGRQLLECMEKSIWVDTLKAIGGLASSRESSRHCGHYHR